MAFRPPTFAVVTLVAAAADAGDVGAIARQRGDGGSFAGVEWM
jgi:hypothetical protein